MSGTREGDGTREGRNAKGPVGWTPGTSLPQPPQPRGAGRELDKPPVPSVQRGWGGVSQEWGRWGQGPEEETEAQSQVERKSLTSLQLGFEPVAERQRPSQRAPREPRAAGMPWRKGQCPAGGGDGGSTLGVEGRLLSPV